MSADIREVAFEFTCVDRPSVGLVSLPADREPDVGVLIVVGGPQYRVGAHRQFVSLARHLAGQGLAAMRFDVRGMGDCVGEHPGFDHLNGDLRSAMDAFQREVPALRRVVLWGLCDGASAACLYAPLDPRLAGVVLLNPWAETPTGKAAASLKHYYLRRLFSGEFWRKLFAGRVDLGRASRALRGLAGTLVGRRSTAPSAPAPSLGTTPLPVRMAQQLLLSDLPLYIALSEHDLVARQFKDAVLPLPEWDAVRRLQTLEVVHVAGADHTLSTPGAKATVEQLTARWVHEIARGRHRRKLIIKLHWMKSRRLRAIGVFGTVVGILALDH